jgi:protein PhnA
MMLRLVRGISSARIRPADGTIFRSRKRESTRRVSNLNVNSDHRYFQTQRCFSTTSDPEPGPCVKCGDANSYWNGDLLFICPSCNHEWAVMNSEGGSNSINDDVEEKSLDEITRDCNGTVLVKGDSVVLVKDLGKGLKAGLRVAKIRLGDYGNDHDVQANIPGLGTYALKSKFLKKV